MNNFQISLNDVKPDPHNSNWTIPKTWGVWQLPEYATGKKYRMGNNPIREKELIREFGSARLLALYIKREKAVEHAFELNR